MVNLEKVFADALKFDNQALWEEAAAKLGYTVETDVMKANGKEFVTLVAVAEEGDNRGMYMCYLQDNAEMDVKGFLAEKPLCGCGHKHG